MHVIDTHCHLNYLDYEKEHKDIADVIAKAHARNVEQIIHVSCKLHEYEEIKEEYLTFPEIFFALGIHPSHAHEQPLDIARMRQHFQENPRLVAVGEIGLDSYWTKEHLDIQKEVFAQQLALALELDLPVIIHTRGDIAHTTLDMIEASGVRKGVIHCFTEDLAIAQRALALDFHIGVGGIATFKNAEPLREVLRQVPVERILTETDAPYLAPVPHRGKENQPAYTRDVVNYVAAMYGLTPEQFAAQTLSNAQKLFALNK
ncbi:hypothetical protein CJP74_05390 [Psittacicella melopsittaci]|uniref:TatD DNase family protein n=1 Tax=Psittacicella melopsittaci TaxID=2028576 RepID=A0A3A1Y426_9GAMM|nr:TatD family hydrolase [Psittacicella melopsittaci]RIY32201.1 hypothetical protein CJP74_05390 [Psittacicella melopsittaci]